MARGTPVTGHSLLAIPAARMRVRIIITLRLITIMMPVGDIITAGLMVAGITAADSMEGDLEGTTEELRS